MIWARMRIADGTVVTGVLQGDYLHPRTGLGQETAAGAPLPIKDAQFLAPCVPAQFIGLWNNFHAAAERNGWAIPDSPLYFLKSHSSYADPEAEVVIHPQTGRVIFEGELGVVIGKPCYRATADEAEAAILGYTCVNDLTALDVLFADPSFPQWTRAKGMAGFGPLGPVIVTDINWRDLTVRVQVNARERQAYPLSDMILPPAEIIRQISHDFPLAPGDVIACGTSIGARPVKAGDRIEVQIEGIGSLGVTLAGADTSAI